MTRSDRLFITALLISDVVWTSVSFVVAHWVRFASGWFAAPLGHSTYHQLLGALVIISALWLLSFKWCGLYDVRRRISGIDEFYGVLLGVVLATIIFVCFAFLGKLNWFSRSVLGLGVAFDVVLVSVSRACLRSFQADMWRRGFGLRRIVVVGVGPDSQSIAQLLNRYHVGCKFLGYLSAAGGEHGNGTAKIEGEVLGTLADLPDLVQTCDVRDVIVPPGTLTDDQTLDLVSQCESLRLKIRLMPSILDIMKRRGEAEDFDGFPLINVSHIPLHGWNRVAKRLLDVLVSVVALLVTAPLMFITALAIKATSPGPVFYVQERVGERGRIFRMLKFRTMRTEGKELAQPGWTRRNDPRRTAIGSLLRRLSLDELPQLFNVLRGEMSLVGPRPEVPYYVERFQEEVPRYRERCRVKAGLTGWAQVHGLRGDTSIQERVKYDLYYIENWSFLLDLRILVKTAFELLFHKNAY